MKILILGLNGMLGHQMAASLGARHVVAGTLRQHVAAFPALSNAPAVTVYEGVDVRDFGTVATAIDGFSPDAVVNAVGIVKQRPESKLAIECLEVNALLPHRLVDHCKGRSIRIIHVSTDCVFSGRHGSYKDDAFADADDLYGRSKYLGEISGSGIVTVRTSLIGLELTRKKNLVEWFLAQHGEVRGFHGAIFSGLTTIEMARVVERLLLVEPAPSGIYNVSSDPIDKYSLLCGLKERLGMNIKIHPGDEFRCDRSLDSTRFRKMFGYSPPNWSEMLDELAAQVQARARLMASADT